MGAGASVESGIPSAYDCIWDWKHDIFISQNPSLMNSFSNIKIDNVRIAIQNWLDNEKIYPSQDAEEEYSFYAEKALPIEDDRRKYFQHMVNSKTPSLGYHIISLLAETGWIKSVWTTNFDGLSVKASHHYDVTPIEVTLESQKRIYRNDSDKELLCIALHGDYKYGALKNTATELDSQSDILIKAMEHELSNRNLIVMGYSGRDKSLMSALNEAYSQPGGGRLYWCGYGVDCPDSVINLIDSINASGRQAFYIATDGFDKTMLLLSKHCMSDNASFLCRVDELKNSLGNNSNLMASTFKPTHGTLKKIVKSNLYPVSFPTNCFQFKVSYSKGDKPWNYCKSLSEKDIIAVPFEDMVYAWGEKQDIIKACSNNIISEVNITPYTREIAKQNGVFREMLLRAITKLLGANSKLPYSKNRIWDTKESFFYRIDGNVIYAYFGIQLSIVFDFKYTYISIAPAFHYRDSTRYTREVNKKFADKFADRINNKKPNLYINNYVDGWVTKLIGNKNIKLSLPVDKDNGFDFTFGSSSAMIGINNRNSVSNALHLPDAVNKKRIIFNGIECHDPELLFFNPHQNNMVKDFHPMRGLIKNGPFDFTLSNKVLHSSINLGVICPQIHKKAFNDFLNQLNNKHTVNFNVDYVLNFPGFFDSFRAGLNIPAPDTSEWLDLKMPADKGIKTAAHKLGEIINQQLNKLSSSQIDVVFIYIPKEFEPLTSYTSATEHFDLHNFVKAYAVQKNIATQFIREKTLDSNMTCQIMWALSLAIYVKSCRIPWVISGLRKDTAFAGIGYSNNKISSGKDIVIGCSHIYSADGQGLKYKLSKISDVTYDHKRNPFLSEEEAYQLGLNIKELFYKSFTDLPKRVVIHKRTPFRDEEVSGLVKCLTAVDINDIELLEINYEDNIRCFEYAKDFSVDGFPVRRGMCFPINDREMLLFTHGIAPSIRNPHFKYIQGGKTIPLPLRIVKHYGSGSMSQIATEILGLSKMNWNSFGLYSKLPCTIESSNEIARIGWLLSQYEGFIYDYRFFM